MDYYKLKVLNNKRLIITVFMILLLISIGIYYFFFYKSNEIEYINRDEKKEITKVEEEVKDIYVDIKGYVEKPGVYAFKLSDNARINDLIIKAGGLKKDADTSILNLSKKLEDEMAIIIYSKGEVQNFLKTENDLKKKLEICETKLKNNACINDEVSKEKLININNATKEELMTLQGIGEVKANNIIEYRKKTKFESISDLLKVEGISDSLYENIKKSITV